MGELLFDLFQVSLGNRESLRRNPSIYEWDGIYKEAQRQGISGILFYGVQKLPQEQKPPQYILLQWIALSLHISRRNFF